MTDIPETGLYGSGMAEFMIDEAELGTRVALCLDQEQLEPDWFVSDAYYAAEVRQALAADIESEFEL
jgi:hypothetical protein